LAGLDSLINFGVKKLVDYGINKALSSAATPKIDKTSRLDRLDQMIKRLDDIAKQESSNPNSSSVSLNGEINSHSDDVAVSCVACARAHFSTVSGSLKEALRFARNEPEGVAHPEVQVRLSTAEEEIDVLERFDWTPEKVINSPEREREIIQEFQPKVRELRQKIHTIATPDDLEEAAAIAGKLAADFRMAVLRLHGVNTNAVQELAKKVSNGEISIDDAKKEVREMVGK